MDIILIQQALILLGNNQGEIALEEALNRVGIVNQNMMYQRIREFLRENRLIAQNPRVTVQRTNSISSDVAITTIEILDEFQNDFITDQCRGLIDENRLLEFLEGINID